MLLGIWKRFCTKGNTSRVPVELRRRTANYANGQENANGGLLKILLFRSKPLDKHPHWTRRSRRCRALPGCNVKPFHIRRSGRPFFVSDVFWWLTDTWDFLSFSMWCEWVPVMGSLWVCLWSDIKHSFVFFVLNEECHKRVARNSFFHCYLNIQNGKQKQTHLTSHSWLAFAVCCNYTKVLKSQAFNLHHAFACVCVCVCVN